MTTQVLIQRVTNGLIVSPVAQGQTGIDLSQIAVFTKLDMTMLAHVAKVLDQPISMPEIVTSVDGISAALDGADE